MVLSHLDDNCTCSGKQCSKCKDSKCILAFSRDKHKASGLKSSCKKCCKDYREANKDAIHAQSKVYYQRNAERINKRIVEKRAEKIEEVRDYWRRYSRSVDPDHKNALQSHTRARRHNVAGSFTAQEWQDLKASYDYTCLGCHKKEPEVQLTIDHIIPLSMKGNNEISNIQPLCTTCNKAKWKYAIDYRVQFSKSADLQAM